MRSRLPGETKSSFSPAEEVAFLATIGAIAGFPARTSRREDVFTEPTSRRLQASQAVPVLQLSYDITGMASNAEAEAVQLKVVQAARDGTLLGAYVTQLGRDGVDPRENTASSITAEAIRVKEESGRGGGGMNLGAIIGGTIAACVALLAGYFGCKQRQKSSQQHHHDSVAFAKHKGSDADYLEGSSDKSAMHAPLSGSPLPSLSGSSRRMEEGFYSPVPPAVDSPEILRLLDRLEGVAWPAGIRDGGMLQVLAPVLIQMDRCFTEEWSGQMHGWGEDMVGGVEEVSRKLEARPAHDSVITSDLKMVTTSLVKLQEVLSTKRVGSNFEDTLLQRHCKSAVASLHACLRALENEISPDQLLLASDPLASGGYSRVYLSEYKGQTVVAKVFSLSEGAEKVSFWNELSMLKRMNHESIVTIYGAARIQIESSPCIALVMEYMRSGNLYDYLANEPEKVTPPVACQLTHDVTAAMEHVHSLGIQHRDLKSSNVLVTHKDGALRAKVADFGISKNSASGTTTVQYLRGFSPEWSAPEVVRGVFGKEGNALRGPEADVYSYAIILWELATKRVPWADVFPEGTQGQRICAIGMACEDGVRPVIPNSLPVGMVALIENCWDDDPACRPTFTAILRGLEAREWRGKRLWEEGCELGASCNAAAAASDEVEVALSRAGLGQVHTFEEASFAGRGVKNAGTDAVEELSELFAEFAQLFAGRSLSKDNSIEIQRWVIDIEAVLLELKHFFLSNPDAASESGLALIQRIQVTLEGLLRKSQMYASHGVLTQFIMSSKFQGYLAHATQCFKDEVQQLTTGSYLFQRMAGDLNVACLTIDKDGDLFIAAIDDMTSDPKQSQSQSNSMPIIDSTGGVSTEELFHATMPSPATMGSSARDNDLSMLDGQKDAL
ncbi:unnamed protein product [Chrysoparadoxa australica]